MSKNEAKATELTPENLITSGIVSFLEQDVSRLNFGDETFDAVYADRMFQHLENPKQAMKEVVRVLKTGGRLVLADSCWENLTIEGISKEASAIIRKTLLAIIENPLVIKSVGELMIAEGIKQETVTIEKVTLVFESLESSDAVIRIEPALRIGCSGGAISVEEMEMCMDEIKNANPNDIKTSFDFYLIAGKK
jgi:ubiquinone/menaquinone biosynthesis C-methylase UbiE